MPLDLTTFLIAALATWRLAYLVVHDEGPFSLMTKLRGRLDPDQRTWIGRGVNCMVCVSFWLAWPVLGLLIVPWGWAVVWGLALSGAVVLIKLWIERRR